MKPNKVVITALGIGLLWGITEATVGTLLHLIPYPLGTYLWFPIAYGYLLWAATQTQTPSAVLLAAAVAAAVKLTGLFTATRIDYVLNPALSILLEALAMWVILRLAERRPVTGWIRVMLVNSLWRAGYLACQLVLPLWIKQLSPLSGWSAALRFGVIEWAITTAAVVSLGAGLTFVRHGWGLRMGKASSAKMP